MRIVVVTLVLAATGLAMPTAFGQTSCGELGGAVEAEQICHVHTDTPTYRLDLQFPVDYPDQDTLTDYIAQNRDGFVTVAQAPRDVPYEMAATPEEHRSGQPPKGTRSVVLKIFQDVGGPHTSTWYKSFNYDVGAGKPVSFDTLFEPNSKPIDAIYPIVQRELGQQGQIPPGTGRDPSHYQNFAVTDDDVIFYFAPGELLPLNAGASTVRVPRRSLPPRTVS